MNKKLKKAILLSVEVWKELAISGKDKDSLEAPLQDKIADLLDRCPLCDLLRKNKDGRTKSYWGGCPECPLKTCHTDSLFEAWNECKEDSKEAKKCAKKIVDKLEEALK